MSAFASAASLQDNFNNSVDHADLSNSPPGSHVSIYAWILEYVLQLLLFYQLILIGYNLNICRRMKRIFAVWMKPAWQLIYFAKKICSQLVLHCVFSWKWHCLAPIIISVEIYIKYLKGWQKRGMNAIFHITLHILITVKC